MPDPNSGELASALAAAMRDADTARALTLLDRLERLEPDEATWPTRRAELHHSLGERPQELAALTRALALQVDQGRVLDAIASCNAILRIDSDHAPTLETLNLLYTEARVRSAEDPESADGGGGLGVEPSGMDAFEQSEGDADEAPLAELILTEVVPGSRAVQIADAEAGDVSEIPLDSSCEMTPESVPNLHLEELELELELKGEGALDLDRVGQASPAHGAHRSAKEALANIPLFGALDPQSLHTLIRRCEVVVLRAGDVLFRQGDAPGPLYVVVEGAVVPIAEGDTRHRLAVLEEGSFLGEIGLITNQPRNATVEALVDSRLIAIDRRIMWQLVRRVPRVSRVLLRFIRMRLVDTQMRINPFFAALGRGDRATVAKQFRFLEVKAGTRLVEQGRPAEGLFVLLAGELALVDRSGRRKIGTLAPGDLFGGIPLLEGEPARADVVANEKCWVIVLREGRFRRILAANPRLEDVIQKLAVQRDEQLRSRLVDDSRLI